MFMSQDICNNLCMVNILKVVEECAAMESVPGTVRGYVTADMADMEQAAAVIPVNFCTHSNTHSNI